MDNCNANDVDQMDPEEICEYLSLNGLNTKGSESELIQRLKLFLENIAVQKKASRKFDYTFELHKLKNVILTQPT